MTKQNSSTTVYAAIKVGVTIAKAHSGLMIFDNDDVVSLVYVRVKRTERDQRMAEFEMLIKSKAWESLQELFDAIREEAQR